MAQIVHDVAPGANLAFATAFTRTCSASENIEDSPNDGRRRDRRRRRLLRRAVLPGRSGRHGGSQRHRRRRDLPVGRRQRQPLRLLRPRNRVMGSAAVPRRGKLPARGRRALRKSKRKKASTRVTAWTSTRGAGGQDLRDQSRSPWPALDRPAVGRTLERGRHRYRRLPARLDRRPDRRLGRRQRQRQPDAVRVRPVGKRKLLHSHGPAGAQPLLGLPAATQVRADRERLDVTATEYPRSSGTDVVGPTVFGHSGSADAISVGAVPFRRSTVERYSSRGPTTHYFGPVEARAPLRNSPRPRCSPSPTSSPPTAA